MENKIIKLTPEFKKDLKNCPHLMKKYMIRKISLKF